ncbi:MAG: ChaN family lipoprotein [Planctomycetota bacterium]|jgi:hypothetical protein
MRTEAKGLRRSKLLRVLLALLLSLAALYLLRGPLVVGLMKWKVARDWDRRYEEVGELELPQLDEAVLEKLSAHLRQSSLAPQEYIVRKFQDHDVVFLGEYHRVRQQVRLVQEILPLLHQSGVFVLGTEFACRGDQAALDALITAPSYNEVEARRITFNQSAAWCYQDYLDVFRAAWELNRSLPAAARKFRIVGINPDPGVVWTAPYVEELSPGDRVMGETILREIVAKGDKALIHCGLHHAFTRFGQPFYRKADGRWLFMETRAGHFVRREIGDLAFTIALHQPWEDRRGEEYTYPVDGVIDALVHRLGPRYHHVGFDTSGTPFGDLRDSSSTYANGYDELKLADICDGYICQGPLSGLRSVEVAPSWFDDQSLRVALERMNGPDFPGWKPLARFLGPEVMGALIATDADIEQRVRIFQ